MLEPSILPAWLSGWLNTVTLFDALVVILAFFTVAFIARKVWPALKRAANTITRLSLVLESVQGLPAFMRRTDASIEVLRHQVENDHKTNMRDELTKVLEIVEPLERKVNQLVTSDTAQWREISDTRPTPPFQPKE